MLVKTRHRVVLRTLTGPSSEFPSIFVVVNIPCMTREAIHGVIAVAAGVACQNQAASGAAPKA